MAAGPLVHGHRFRWLATRRVATVLAMSADDPDVAERDRPDDLGEGAPPKPDVAERDRSDDPDEGAPSKPDVAAAAPPTKPCRACGHALRLDAVECDNCGAPQKGAPICPHHRGAAGTSPHPELRYVCNVCGAPRIHLTKTGVELSGDEVPMLTRAREARARRSAWRVAGVLGAAVGAFTMTTLGILWLLFGVGLASGVLGLGISLPFLLVAAMAVGKSRAKSSEIARAIDQAWQTAARDVARGQGSITAKQLGEILPIGEQAAENALAMLTVDDVLESEVTRDGKLAFKPVRIEALDVGDDLSADRELEAEFERLEAEEEQQKEKTARARGPAS